MELEIEEQEIEAKYYTGPKAVLFSPTFESSNSMLKTEWVLSKSNDLNWRVISMNEVAETQGEA